MRLLKIYHAGDFGRSAAACAAAALPYPCELVPADREGLSPNIVTDEAPFAVFLSHPNPFALERIGAAAGTKSWIAAFPFERHVVVTPVFAPGHACAPCFVKRWLCQPPAGYHGELVLAISTLCNNHAIREYRNLSPLAAPLAAKVLLLSSAQGTRSAICCDTAGLHIESAKIRPLHGCRCRSAPRLGNMRFATFGENLSTMLQEIGGDPR
jgi:hypothetical protein